jgi:hypothetical protein
MYGCVDANIIFGFCEKDRNAEISSEWLEEFFRTECNGDETIKQPEAYARDVVRLYGGDTVYGVTASLNSETGEITVDTPERELMKKLYERVSRTHKEKYTPLGYHLGMHGDLQNCHDMYNPTEEEEEEEPASKKAKVEAKE